METGGICHTMVFQVRLLLCLVIAPLALGHWLDNAVVYQIYPRSFKDSNGDGTGDLKGISDSLDYLKDLGVTAVWLSPIYQSPMKDFGYDVSNFTAIDPIFGTMQDFENLAKTVKDKGMKLLLDFIPNHTSDKHIWFQKSCNNEPGFADFYVWRAQKNNWKAIFPDGSQPAWSKCGTKRNQFYYHTFGDYQPDLNYNNPKVVAEMKNVLKFWMDKGVDGFRMDAVPYLVEDSKFQDEMRIKGCNDNNYRCFNHTHTMDLPGTYNVLRNFSQFVQEYSPNNGTKPERAVFFEAYTSPSNTMKYYDSMGTPFNFNLLTSINMMSSSTDFKKAIESWMTMMPKNKTANWVIGNHDNSRIGSKVGPEMIDGMNMLNLLLPGTTVTYYGEELGMTDGPIKHKIDPSGRDPERTPFQWSDETYAGFMPVNGSNIRPWLPVNPNYWDINKKKEESEESSHLKVYKKLVDLKNKIGDKSMDLKVHNVSEWVLVVERSSNESTVVIVLNLNNLPEKVNLTSLVKVNDLKVHITSVNSDKNLKEGSSDLNNLPLTPRSGIVLSTSSVMNIVCSPLLLMATILLSVYHHF